MNLNRAHAHRLILIVVGIAVLMTQLGNTHLWDQDEGYYAATAAEMFERKDWVVPTFNGKLFGHKPPVMFWGMMAGYHFFGVSELGARFVSSLFGLGTILVTYALAKRLFDAVTGLFSGLAIGSCLMFVMVARSATADAHLTFFTVLAMYVWSCDYMSRPQVSRDQRLENMRWYTWALAYAVMGLAVLTKGPIGFLFPTAVLGLFLLTEQERIPVGDGPRGNRLVNALLPYSPLSFLRTVWRMRPFMAAATVLAVAGPWYCLVQWKTDGEFLREFIGVHHLGRFSNAMDNHSGPFYYYFVACLIGMYPWSAFAIPTAIAWYSESQKIATTRSVRFVSCWVAVYLVIFSLASTKLPNYVLPAYPALAIMAGRYFALWSHRASEVNAFWLNMGWGLLVAVGISIAVGFPALSLIEFQKKTFLDSFDIDRLIQSRLAWVGVVGTPLAFLGMLGWALLRHGRTRLAAGTFSFASICMIIMLCQWIAPEMDRLQVSQSLAEDWKHQGSEKGSSVTVLGHFRPSMVFYFGRPLQFCDSPDDAMQMMHSHENSILVTTDEHYEQIKGYLPKRMEVLQRVAQFPEREELVVLGNQSLMR